MATDLNQVWQPLRHAAENLAQWLFKAERYRIIFAESCTCGLCAAAMGQVPGISSYLSGSAVTYRPNVKLDWLKVDPRTISEYTTESAEITREMATGVLHSTDDPHLSAAVTGHLGPGIDSAIDGRIFIAIGQRHSSGEIHVIHEQTGQLTATTRIERQVESAAFVIQTLADACQTMT